MKGDSHCGSNGTGDRLGDIVSAVRQTGFSCWRCGACCRADPLDPAVVLVSPEEVRRIMDVTGLSREAIAGPYPDVLESRAGGRFTLAWCLLQRNGRCIFLSDQGCRIYGVRPWICRTFPFALDGGDVTVSSCPGTGCTIGAGEAVAIARDLVSRQEAEAAEEEGVRRTFAASHIPPGVFAVIDSEGVWVQE